MDIQKTMMEKAQAAKAASHKMAILSSSVKNAALNKFAAANNKKYGDKTYIGWNFTKFLVDREGKVVARFEPTVDMGEVKAAVAAELNK